MSEDQDKKRQGQHEQQECVTATQEDIKKPLVPLNSESEQVCAETLKGRRNHYHGGQGVFFMFLLEISSDSPVFTAFLIQLIKGSIV